MAVFYALIALCLFESALAQVPFLGYCPCVEGIPNFNIFRFTEDWYEYARYFTLVEIGGKCNVVNFIHFKNGIIRVINNFTTDYTHGVQTAHADLTPNPEYPSETTGKVPMTPLDAISDCTILGTDYDSFGVIYCCTQYKYFNLRWAWLMTRERLPPKSAVDKAYEAIDKNKVERKHFLMTEQKQCPAKPCA